MATKKKSMLVKDAMHKGVVSVDSSTTVKEAIHKMNELQLRSLVVIDFDCALPGIVTQTDIVAAKLLAPEGKKIDEVAVGEIMTSRALTVEPNMSIREATAIIVKHRLHRVVVADPEDICNPVGILSLTDVMRYLEDHDF
jgi:CBS domain-containing protein